MAVRVALEAMRTRFEALAPDPRESGETGLSAAGRATLRAAAEAALQEIAEVEPRLSRFRPGSVVNRILTLPARTLRLSRDETALFAVAQRVWRRSAGAFDPTASADPEAIEPFSAWRIDCRRRELTAPAKAVAPDLGGIGKGYALDLAARRLREAEVGCALLHGGTSSVVALGAPPGAAAWRVGIRSPIDPARLLATVALKDESLSVSATHGRKVFSARLGRKVAHIVDPRDGRPLAQARLVAVVSRNGTAAEAWSTALLVLLERALRAGRPITAVALGVPPSIRALLAFERGGELVLRQLGPRTEAFTLSAIAASVPRETCA